MQGEELYSNNVHFSVSIAEVDRLPESEEEAAQYRQLCGVSISFAKHYIRVSVHSSAGTTSHSIPRHFPDKTVYYEIGTADGLAGDHEVQLGDI